MQSTRFVLAGLLLAALTTPAAVITPTSYSFTPAADVGYPDSGGTELTDGVLAAGVVNDPATDGVPYVAWNNVPLVTITFQFDQSYNFSTVQLGFLRSTSFNFAYLPTAVSIAGQDFSVDPAAITNNSRGFVPFSPVGLTANSITLEMTPTSGLWLLMDEVVFEGSVPDTGGGVPEPATVGLIGLSAVLMAFAYRKR